MTIDEIFNRILLRSGQFILRKARIELDVDSFRVLVEDALSDYSGFAPYTTEYTLDLNASRFFTFPLTYDPDLERAPDWLSEVTPINSFGSLATVFQKSSIGSPTLVEPVMAPWKFNKKTKVLTTPYSSFYKVIAVFEHEIRETVTGGKTTFDVPTIDKKDQPFFDLLRGMFLVGIGRSRRAFTLNDLPILMDADTLVSEGEAIIEKANEAMLDDQKFHLAFE